MKRILFAGLFICAFAIAAVAQSTSGVTGTVTDPQGARVVGATVTLTDTKTSKELTTTTGDDGVYRFVAVPPGEGYKITLQTRVFRPWCFQTSRSALTLPKRTMPSSRLEMSRNR